jgi:hypothetical protein
MNNDIPEVNLKLETIEVKAKEVGLRLTVRKIFYKGVNQLLIKNWKKVEIYKFI